jgi:hypothetical protein
MDRETVVSIATEFAKKKGLKVGDIVRVGLIVKTASGLKGISPGQIADFQNEKKTWYVGFRQLDSEPAKPFYIDVDDENGIPTVPKH